jgi:hypothetical protein
MLAPYLGTGHNSLLLTQLYTRHIKNDLTISFESVLLKRIRYITKELLNQNQYTFWGPAICRPEKARWSSHILVLTLADIFWLVSCKPVTVAARSTAWTVFARSNAGIDGSNPARGMDICVRLFFVCVGSALATGWSPVQGILPTVYGLKAAKVHKGCRAIDRYIDR